MIVNKLNECVGLDIEDHVLANRRALGWSSQLYIVVIRRPESCSYQLPSRVLLILIFSLRDVHIHSETKQLDSKRNGLYIKSSVSTRPMPNLSSIICNVQCLTKLTHTLSILDIMILFSTGCDQTLCHINYLLLIIA